MMRQFSPVVFAPVFLAAAGIATPALADVKAGAEAWALGDHAKAVALWRPLAIKGNADAQYYMGQAYKAGRGVPLDLKQAEDWYRRAAEQGHPGAEANVGLVMFQNGKRQEALPWIRKAADRGDPRAQYLLGTAMFNGDLVAKDWVQAYALMTRASASGLPAASNSLGQMDKFIPVDQRQRGLKMARDMEIASQQAAPPSIGGVDPAPPRRPVVSQPVARTVDLPPSRPSDFPEPSRDFDPDRGPGANFDFSTPEQQEAPDTAPRDIARPKPKMTPKPVKMVAPKAPPPAARSAAPKATASSGGRWRVQLGAFGEEGRARALFSRLESKVPALRSLQPYLVKAGAITRLQAGPLASGAAADQLCGQIRAAGGSCLTLAP
jgi:uncharacterized protein